MFNKNGKRGLTEVTDVDEQGSGKKSKSHTFFSSFAARKEEAKLPPSRRSTVKQDAPKTVEHFLHLDPFATNTGESSSSTSKKRIRIAMYDLDGTLIQPKSGNKFPKNADDWKWWHAKVKPKLAEAHSQGQHLVIISNQKLADKKLKEWREKVHLICADLPEHTPVRVLAATASDQFRKPGTGLFDFLREFYEAKGLEIDLEHSFYVGDAAGRDGDHNDTDRKFADNAGLMFYTPEQYFKNSTTAPVFRRYKGFDAKAELPRMDEQPLVTPTNKPIVPTSTKEIVLFVGYPASGKTSFFNKYFKPEGYIHVNQDTLKTREKCLAAVRDSMTFGSVGCVVDNTNRDKTTRALYIAMAMQLRVPIRCFFFTASYELAKHNNAYRACAKRNVPEAEKRDLLPETAFLSFKKSLEEPDATEGFDEIRRVNFNFDGSEEERKIWSRWMT
ncbi:hypothetical protein NliqN6_5247 [Naganishia liquefaciens]|uniref:Uncharacterized protein n=1 Tax=Naganishia liquefaciens TaxID=104408 RepID=A0A8H3TXV8_9TREE|nr:hypothetical protein NliqN6_5247 [Naganishia liquefaciens]